MAAFGTTFTDHMVVRSWTVDDGWSSTRLLPYGPFQLEPASAVLHYGQEIFEGLKAFAHPDGEVRLFRPDANAARMRASARRLALPELDEDAFCEALEMLVDADREQVPEGPGQSLYLRPFMFGSEAFIGVRAARAATFGVIASPVAGYFGSSGDDGSGITAWWSGTYSRAGVGGTGDVKCGGNYAASLVPRAEAKQHGCAQAVFTDADGYLEEAGTSALFLVFVEHGSPVLVTPSLQGTILPSINRDATLRLAGDLGIEVRERAVHIDEWREGAANGRLAEAFACGTAAAISPISGLRWHGGEIAWGTGPVTARLADALSDIQYGHAPDPYGWMRIVPPRRGKDHSLGYPGTPPDGGYVASGLEEIGSVPL